MFIVLNLPISTGVGISGGEEKTEDPVQPSVKDIYGYGSEGSTLPPLGPVKQSHKKIAVFLAILCFIFLLGIIILAILCK